MVSAYPEQDMAGKMGKPCNHHIQAKHLFSMVLVVGENQTQEQL